MAGYHVEVANKGAFAFDVISKDYTFRVDIKGNGVTPPDALLGSLGSCIGVYVRKYCDGARIPLGEFSVTVDAEFTDAAPVCFRSIRAYVDLKGLVLDERRSAALQEFIKNCPVHNTLHANPSVEIVVR